MQFYRLFPLCLFLTYFFFDAGLAQDNYKDISSLVGTDNKGGNNIGIAFCDYNKDHLADLYVSRRNAPNHLYKNLGNGLYEEVAADLGLDYSGHTRMATWGDLNNDGFEDVYLGNLYEADVLFLNNGDGTFTDITQIAGIRNDAQVFSVNMADVNEDGWLDIYVSNAQSQNVLYLNLRKESPSFVNFASAAGVVDTRHCMGAVFFDMDNDGDEDLYVTHDANIPNTLYINNGQGRFREIAQEAGVAYKGFGMGVDAGDFNRDGFMDLYVTNLYENVLYINNGDGTFSDMTKVSDVGDIGMGWGASIFDHDNDGWQDIYVGNDSYFYPNPNLLYDNKGNLKFKAAPVDAIVSSMQGTYGVASGDVDNNGTQDLALANIGSKDFAQILSNERDPRYWIGLILEGIESNRDAIGTRIEVLDNKGERQYDYLTAGNGYAGQNSKRVHFGFGYVSVIKEIKLTWPSGLIQTLKGLELGQYYKVQEGFEPEVLNFSTPTSASTLKNELSIKTYPNPTSRYLEVELPAQLNSNIHIQLIDSQGKICFQQTGISSSKFQVDMGSKKGWYELLIRIGDQSISKKILVLH